MRTALLIGLAAASLGACTSSDDSEPTFEQTCTDPEYGDGTCQLSLACGVPDIDCFAEIEDDEAARHEIEFTFSGRPLPTTDDRYKRARRIADRVWSKVPEAMPIDALAIKHLAVVVIDDPTPNAFVAPIPIEDKMAIGVAFHAGILTSEFSDDALVSITAHELGHLLNLHAFPEARDGGSKYYVAPVGQEPLGINEANDARILPAIGAWQKAAYDGGSDHRTELGNIPLGGMLGGMYDVVALDTNGIAGDCAPQGTAFATAFSDAYKDLTLAEVPRLAPSELAALTTAFDAFHSCLSAQPVTFDEVNSVVFGAGISLRENEHYLATSNASVAFDTLVTARRTEVAQREVEIEAALEVPLDALRWYSFEEQADDFAADYTRVDPLDEPGAASGMAALLGDRLDECETAREDQTVPYGDLSEPHHATCWRRDHAFRYAQSAGGRRAHHVSRVPFVPTKKIDMKRIY